MRINSSNPLTIKDLSVESDIDSPGVLYYHLNQLVKKGYLKKNPNNSKDYIVLDSPEENILYIGNYGKARCGHRGNILDGTPLNHIPIATSLLRFSAKEAFIVEADGDSMQPKIFEGDVIIAKKQNSADHGDLVVCSYNDEVLIKKYICQSNSISLVSLNQEKYHPIVVSIEDHFVISGIVKNILAYH
nr:S24 family peptidase [Tenacibaculum ovolyticum]